MARGTAVAVGIAAFGIAFCRAVPMECVARVRIRPRLMSCWIKTHLDQPLLEVSVPIVLYLIVSPLGQVCSNGRPPATTTKKAKRQADQMIV